jgi:predicted permease
MRLLSEARERLRALLFRGRAERELAEELRFHVDMETEANVRRGMTPAEARRRALIAFGGVERFKDEVRDLRGFGPLEDLVKDARLVLRRAPGFAALTAVILALGIGATTTVFTLVSALLLRPLPYDGGDRIVLVTEAKKDRAGESGTTSYVAYDDWRRAARSFEALAVVDDWTPALTGAGEPERLRGAMVTAGVFDVLRIAPHIGRRMLPSDNVDGGERAAWLSYGLWRRRFGGNPDVLGRPIVLNGYPRTIVGVLPRDFRGPAELDAEIWGNNYRDSSDARDSRYLRVLGRLKSDVPLDAARAEMRAISARDEEADPKANGGYTAVITPLRDELVGAARAPLALLSGGAALVLLVACANLSGLLLSRGIARAREMAVRAALGAGRGRLIRQLLTESLVLAVCGAAVGLALAAGATRILVGTGPEVLRAGPVNLDGRVLAFTAGLTVLTALLVGLAPALRAARPDLVVALKGGGRGASAPGTAARIRRTLVVVQLALALALLTGAGLLLKSFARLQQVDPGIRPHGVLTAAVVLPSARYPEESTTPFYERLLDRIRALPGIRAAAASSIVPFGTNFDRIGVEVEGRPSGSSDDLAEGDRYIVSPGFFAAMGVPLKQGRSFTERDRHDAALVAVVDEEFARRTFPGESPVGKRLKLPMRDSLATIVGVAGHVKHYGLDATSPGQIYMPVAQYPWRYMVLVVRAEETTDPLALVPSVRAAVHALDPGLPLDDVATMGQLMAGRTAVRRFIAALLGWFAGVAAVMATIGLYGTMAYAVEARRAEIGIRIALGAEPRRVRQMVVRQGLGLAAAGVALGITAAAVGGRLMRGLLFGVSGTDPSVLGGVAAGILIVGLAASWVPAQRAARIDPIESLRAD